MAGKSIIRQPTHMDYFHATATREKSDRPAAKASALISKGKRLQAIEIQLLNKP